MAKISKTTVTVNKSIGKAASELARHMAAFKELFAGDEGMANAMIKRAEHQADQYVAKNIREADGVRIMKVTTRPEIAKQMEEDFKKYAEMTGGAQELKNIEKELYAHTGITKEKFDSMMDTAAENLQ